MKNTTFLQEILLNTQSSYAKQEWISKDRNDNPKTEIDGLEEACWNGLVRELMEQVNSLPLGDQTIWIQDIRRTHSFLEMDLCTQPAPMEGWYSLDPQTYLFHQFMN